MLKQRIRGVTNFTFQPKTKNLLDMMCEKYGVSRTKVMEEAIEEYAVRRANEKANMMSFAGSIAKEDGSTILEAISEDRRNKEVRV